MKRGGIRISMQVLLMVVFAAMLAVGCSQKTGPQQPQQERIRQAQCRLLRVLKRWALVRLVLAKA